MDICIFKNIGEKNNLAIAMAHGVLQSSKYRKIV
jgi:hypothetical protein